MSAFTKSPEKPYPLRAFLTDILRYLRPHRSRAVAATLLRVSGDLALLVPGLAFATMVHTFSTSSAADQSMLIQVLLAWGVCALWRAAALPWARYVMNQVAEQGALEIGFEINRHLLSLDMAWQERETAGSKMKRIQKAMDGFNNTVRAWVGNIIEVAVSFFGSILVIAAVDGFTAAAMTVFLLTYVPISIVTLRSAAAAWKEANLAHEHITALQFEIVNNIRTSKLLGITGFLVNRYRERAEPLFLLLKKRIARHQSRGFILGTYAELFQIAVIAVIVFGIVRGRYDVGFLVLFNVYFSALRQSAEQLSGISENLSTARLDVMRGMQILDEPLDIEIVDKKSSFPDDWQRITVENLSFRYGEREVLRDISFTINRGEKIGIVGESGAGKSTLFRLLLKEFESYQGGLYVDGTPLRDIRRAEFLAKIGVVLQDTEVFNLSLEENVLLSAHSAVASMSVEEALKISRVEDFLPKLPDGTATVIGEKGVRLSGGERQRLGIARAIIKRPQILFLDEATSHLDLESEEKIQDSLSHIFADTTAIVIAHRLTTIRKMDRIIVMAGGRIIEEGSFRQLLDKKGRFAELWEKQYL